MAVSAQRSRLILQSEEFCPLGQVSLAGHLRDSKGISAARPRVFGRYALVLLEGSGRVSWENRPPVPVRTGDLLFVYPEIVHWYGPGPGEKWNEFYLVFNGPIFDWWRSEGLFGPPCFVRHLPQLRRWLPRLEAAAGADLPPTTQGMLQRVCRLQEFLGGVVENPPSRPEPAPWLERARRQLIENPGLNAVALARSLGLSYETFRKEFARRTGQSPGRFRLHRLIEQAHILIRERGLNNKQVAETLGFYDEFHFSRRFRQVTGQSTRQFRSALLTRGGERGKVKRAASKRSATRKRS
jgi:AraC-like DNA-binding protein